MPGSAETITSQRTAGAGRFSHSHRGSPFEPAVVFVAAVAIPLYLGLRGGGFDLVERQQATLAIWWLVAVGILFGLFPRARPGARARGVLVLFSLLTAWTAAGLIWTESTERTFIEATRTLDYMGLVALVWFGVHRHSWRAGAAGLLTGAGAISLLAVATRVAPDLLPADTVALQFGGERLSYPLDYWNATAYWSAAVFVAAVAWSAHTTAVGARALLLAATPVAGAALFLSYSRGGALVGFATLIMVVAASRKRGVAFVHAGVATLATLAVSGLIATQPEIADGTGQEGGGLIALGLLLACVLTGSLARWTARPRLRRRRVLRSRSPVPSEPDSDEALDADPGPVTRRTLVLGASAVAVVVAGALAVSAVDSKLSRTPYDPGTGGAASRLLNVSDGRGELYDSALEAFSAEPVTGIGAGTYGLWHERTRPEADRVQDAHSFYLEALAELGLPGLLLALASIGTLALLALSAARRLPGDERFGPGLAMCAMFSVIAIGSAVDWLWEVPAVTALGLAAGAIVWGSQGAPRRRRRLNSRRLAAALILIVLGALHVPPIVSEERTDAALFQLTIGNETRALELADEAVDAQPWAASARVARATVQIELGDLEAAADDAAAAVRLEPTNWRHRALQLQVALQRGDTAAAAEASDALQGLIRGDQVAP
jgi:O-antigen ligase